MPPRALVVVAALRLAISVYAASADSGTAAARR